MEETAEDFGRHIRSVRKSKGLSIEELAIRTKLSPNGIGRIELGHRSPTGETLIRLARGLNVEPGELFPKAHASHSSEAVDEERRFIKTTLRTWIAHLERR